MNYEDIDVRWNSRKSVRNAGMNLVKTLDILTDNSLQPKFSDENRDETKNKELVIKSNHLSTNKIRPKTSVLSRNRSRYSPLKII